MVVMVVNGGDGGDSDSDSGDDDIREQSNLLKP